MLHLSGFRRIAKRIPIACRKMSILDGYGSHAFKGAVSAPFLTKQGLDANVLDNGKWTSDGSADKVFIAKRNLFEYVINGQ